MNYRYERLTEGERESIIGFCVDDTFFIYDGSDKIGIVATSSVEPRTICEVPEHDPSTVFVEWIEVYESFRKRGYLGRILCDVFEKYDVHNIMFECSDELKEMYLHLGAEEVSYESFREMWTMNLREKKGE